ncbi:host nuclease inhibitor GamL [Escherichia coli]
MNAYLTYDRIEDRRWAEQQITDEKEKWIDGDGICDRTFDLVTKPKVVTPQGKSRLFTRRAIEQSQEGRRQECIARAARRSRLIAQGLYIDEMESIL